MNNKLSATKSIGFFGGLCFLFNAVSGPAIPYTAANFANTGWLFTILAYVTLQLTQILFTFLSGFNSMFLIESMQAIPGNKHFQGKVEFSTLVNFFFGPRLHVIGQFILYAAIQSNAIQSLVLTSQVCIFNKSTDRFIMDIAGSTCGLTMSFQWMCVQKGIIAVGSPSPFDQTFMIFTYGFLAVLICCVPLFFIDMDSSISVIVGATILSVFVTLQWVSASVINGLEPSRMPLSTSFNISYIQTLGVVMLNMGCATVIPSWVNIKAMHVRTQSVMWTTVSSAATFYIIIGIFFALGFETNSSNNSLQALLEMGSPVVLSRITVAMYDYVMLLPSVPVNFTICSDNLIQNKIVGKRAATILSFVLPIFVCIPLQTRNYLFLFLTWTSLTFASTANFIIPLGIYIKAIEFRKEFNSGRILSPHQLALLVEIHSESHEIGDYIADQSQRDIVPGSGNVFSDAPAIVLVPPVINIIDPSGNYADTDSVKTESKSGKQGGTGIFFKNKNANILSRKDSTSTRSSESSENWLDIFKNSGLNEYSKIAMKSPNSLYPTLDSVRKIDTESSNSVGPADVLGPVQISDDSSFKSSVNLRNHRVSPQIDEAWFEEDVPDPESDLASQSMHELRIYPTDRQNSMSSHESQQSLPRDPNFKAPAFRAVPKWLPIKPRSLSWALLSITSFISVTSLILQIVIYGFQLE